VILVLGLGLVLLAGAVALLIQGWRFSDARTAETLEQIGAFCARSSAAERRRLRISIARFRMIWPVEVPRVSP